MLPAVDDAHGERPQRELGEGIGQAERDGGPERHAEEADRGDGGIAAVEPEEGGEGPEGVVAMCGARPVEEQAEWGEALAADEQGSLSPPDQEGDEPDAAEAAEEHEAREIVALRGGHPSAPYPCLARFR